MYTPPSLNIHQELVSQAAGNTLPLYACIIAPQYGLHRYRVEDEKESLGAYDPLAGNTYTAWPGRSAGSTIDLHSARIYAEDALLKYSTFTLSGGVGDGLTVNGGNKIRAAGLVFKTNAVANRSNVFGTRDVALGDYVKVIKGTTAFETTVAGLEAETVAATIGGATAAAGNATAKIEAATVVANITAPNFTVTANATAYNGLADGYVEEVYTCTVISTDGTLTGTVISIVSASGTDNIASKTLSDSGLPTACGTRGATFTLTDTSSQSSDDESSDVNTLVVGDSWVVTVSQNYTVPTPVATGTYIGDKDTTYIVTITQGGVVGTNVVRYKVTTNNGVDRSYIDVSVTGAGNTAVGNYGVLLTLTAGAQLVTGDSWMIAVTAKAKGAIKTIVLASKLTGVTTTDALTVVLGLRDSCWLDSSFWTVSENLIQISAGAVHRDDYLGTIANFDILAANLYIEYRELLRTLVNKVGSISDRADIPDILGPVHEDNPVAFMADAALSMSNGTGIYYVTVSSDDAHGYSDALEALTLLPEGYSLVPYNTTKEVRDVVYAHITAEALPAVANFKIAWFGIDMPRLNAFYTKSEGSVGSDLLATLTNTTLICSNAQFLVNKVRVGDTIRINYQPDGTGRLTYDSYTVTAVVSDTELTVTPAAPTPIVVPVKMEVWRTATNLEYVDLVTAIPQAYRDRRVYTVWSESVTYANAANVTKSVLCAVLAGLRSAVAPHQPLTNYELTSIEVANNTNFGSSLLNKMAEKGVWVVVKDLAGKVYTRHQLSSDPTDLYTREQTKTTNLDHICRDFKLSLKDLYGKGNAVPSMLELIRSRVYSTADKILARKYSDMIGAQILDLTIVRLEVDPVLKDQVWLEVELVTPDPMNKLTARFRLI